MIPETRLTMLLLRTSKPLMRVTVGPGLLYSVSLLAGQRETGKLPFSSEDAVHERAEDASQGAETDDDERVGRLVRDTVGGKRRSAV